MYIETERLIIRSLELTDEKTFIEMASDGSLRDIFGDCSNCSEWMREWLEEAILLDKENNPQKSYLAYAIIEKKRNLLIGSIGCSFYDDLKQIGITYCIGANHRRRGYATEAVHAYAKYFLEHYEVSEMIATIRTENKASCKTAEKSGFVFEETKMYQDINDSEEEEYNFYSFRKAE